MRYADTIHKGDNILVRLGGQGGLAFTTTDFRNKDAAHIVLTRRESHTLKREVIKLLKRRTKR